MVIRILKYLHFYIISALPFWLIYALSDLLYYLTYYLVRYRRKVVRANLTRSFPDKSPTETLKIEKEFYRHFADVILETLKLLTIGPESIKERFSVSNPHLMSDYFKEQKDILLYASHYGNWEWLVLLSSYIPHTTTTIY